MIENLKRYPAYKESGVEWLGKVPVHWELPRLGALLQERGEINNDGRIEEVLSVLRNRGVIPYSEKGNLGNKRSEDITRYKVVRPDDIVVNCMNVIIGSAGLSRYTGCLSPVYYVLTKRSEDDHPGYLNAYFQTKPFQESLVRIGNGILAHRMRIPMELLKCEPFPRPPTEEQVAIVRFLDHADRRIRRYIRAKQKLIKLLEEQKQAIINQAVTGQIDVRTGQPYPAYKESGVEWMGDVPEHWEVRRLKTLCDMQSGDAITAMSIDEVGKYPVFGGNGLRGYAAQYTHDGDFVLVGRQGALCGNIHIARGRFWASEHAVVATLRRKHVLEWFGALLEIMNLNQYSIAAAQPGLSVDRVLNLWAPVPSADEQATIVRFLDHADRRIRRYIGANQKLIGLLEEQKQAIINQAVTGQIDVREAAAGLPDEVEEPEPFDETSALIDGEEEPSDNLDAVTEEAEV